MARVFSGVMGAAAANFVEPSDMGLLLFFVVSSGGFGFLVPAVALKAKHCRGAVVAIVASAVPLGMLNAIVVLAIPGTFSIYPVDLEFLFWMLPVAAVPGGVLGLFFGLALAPPVTAIKWLMMRPSIDGPDRAGVVLSLSSLALSGLYWGLLQLSGSYSAHVGPILLLLACVSACMFVVFGVRFVRRKRWIERVRKGLVDGWAIVPEGVSTESVPHLTPEVIGEPRRWLVEIRADGESPYREQEHITPRAALH